MPANPLRNPFTGNENPPLIDLRLRNGWVVRQQDPGKWRWKPWREGCESPFDIIDWQESVK